MKNMLTISDDIEKKIKITNLLESTLSTEGSTPTSDIDKVNVPVESWHDASYISEFINGEPKEKIQTRASLRKLAFITLVFLLEPK